MPDEGTKFRVECKLAKVDADLGLVFGWGVVCTESGEPYVDRQDEHIPEAVMLKGALDFAINSGAMDDSHDEVQSGVVRFHFPLTTEIAKAYGITCERTGWMIAAAPDPDLLAKYVSGEYTAFSIGGYVLASHDEQVAA